MTPTDKARQFAALHVRGAPLILFNIWDAGSAQAVAKAGATAVATSSWAVAAAHGFADGEAVPLDFALTIAERVAAAVPLPATLDFEGGYGETPAAVGANARRAIATGIIGINFEDRRISGEGLYDIDAQCRRIAAIRAAAEAAGLDLFINARTDLFLGSPAETHAGHVEEAIARGDAYARAGASGLFVPGLADPALIATVCGRSELPVNVMAVPGVPAATELAAIGVARVSFGPMPWLGAMDDLRARARTALAA